MNKEDMIEVVGGVVLMLCGLILFGMLMLL
jgi:hypothetical protein